MAEEGFARRRSLRVFCLGALSIARHHYFSFVTAGVLAVIGFVAATSSSYEEKRPQEAAGNDESRWAPADRRSLGRGHNLIYYVVESEEQAATIDRGRRGDITYAGLTGGSQDFGLVSYLEARTLSEEAEMGRLLHTIVEEATHDGFTVTIIDLRK